MWVKVIAGVSLSLYCFISWGRYDFCAGWAGHYEVSASQLRVDAQDPQLPPDEVHDCLIVAGWHEIIARKFWRAARPWPFNRELGTPMITKSEQIVVLENLRETKQLPRDVADAGIVFENLGRSADQRLSPCVCQPTDF